jgi:TetR/AcrR family transcriptional regulator
VASLKRLLCPVVPHDASQDPTSRERLLKAATEVFERKGYAATSVREIVERAGVTKPALYYHFGSKEGLMVGLLEASLKEMTRVVTEAVSTPGTYAERIQRMCLAICRLSVSNSSVLRVSHTAYFSAPDALPSFDFQSFDEAFTGVLERLVREGIAAGEFRPVSPVDAAYALAGPVVVAIHEVTLRRENRLDEAGLVRVIDIVLDGLRQAR